MEMYGIIYKIENRINGKLYIGQTIKTLRRRWTNHKSYFINNKHNNSYLQNAVNKYGIENFTIKLIAKCSNKDDLDVLEDYYIFIWETMNRKKGYNLKRGGANGKHSKETKRKISEAKKGEKNAFFGKHHTKDMKRKMSLARKGRKLLEETKKKMSESRKNSERFQEAMKNPERCKRISESLKGEKGYWFGKKFSEDHKKKISEKLKGRPNLKNRKTHLFDYFTGEEYKHCSKCNEWKNLSNFYKDKRNWDKLKTNCRECSSNYLRNK